MRIAIVAEPYVSVPPKQYGGTEQVIYYLIKGLVESGHEPILLGAGDSEVPCDVIPIVDKALLFPKKRSEVASHNKLVAEARQRTKQVLRRLLPKIDIVHSHYFDLLDFKNFPNLTTIHNKFELGDLAYYKKRKELYFASISENQQAGCPSLNYVGVVYNGEDPKSFPFVEKPDDYLCFLGRFDRDKSPHLAIQLAINLGMKIKVAGKIDHQGEGYFEDEVAKYFDHPLVEYLGELDFNQKVDLLSKAKCNLHPTGFREPFGLTVLEAAYCGTPTLAIARGAMPELIEDGKSGKLVEDFVEGYHAINECFAMDRRYIAARARHKFNYREMTKDYLKAYRMVIHEFAEKSKRAKLSERLTPESRQQLQLLRP